MARHLSYINHRGTSEPVASLKSRGQGLLAAVVHSETGSCWFVKTNRSIGVTSATLDATGHYLKCHLTYFADAFHFTLGQFTCPKQQIQLCLSQSIVKYLEVSEVSALPLDKYQSQRCLHALHPFSITASICLLSETVSNNFQVYYIKEKGGDWQQIRRTRKR